MQALLLALRPTLSAAERERFAMLVADEESAGLLLEQAQWHGVLALMNWRLRSNEMLELLPEKQRQKLRLALFALRAQTMQQVATLSHVLHVAEEHDIKALAWKGPALSMLLYGDYGLRQSCDLDFLVVNEDLRSLTDALVGAGFEPSAQAKTDAGTLQARKVFHEVKLHRGNVHLELHDEFMPLIYGQGLALKRCMTRTQIVEIADHESLRSLAPADLLVSLCGHGAKHKWLAMKWICDVQGLLLRFGSSIAWEPLIAESSSNGTLRSLLNGVMLCAAMLGSEVPDAIAAAAAKDSELAALIERQKRSILEGCTDTRVSPLDLIVGLRGRAMYYLRKIAMLEPGAVDSSGGLFLLCYPLHWLRLTCRGFKLLWR